MASYAWLLARPGGVLAFEGGGSSITCTPLILTSTGCCKLHHLQMSMPRVLRREIGKANMFLYGVVAYAVHNVATHMWCTTNVHATHRQTKCRKAEQR